ncbi:MAG TPA: hypothetical protein VKG23_08725 [Thermoanaerobaculia bacterium]|nr:hypothetical protein [Thermoanaerobaculia bacterium]
MQRRWTLGLAVLGVLALVLMGAPALADDKLPDATIRLSEGSVAAGIGWSWGSGEISYQGKTYRIKIDGLSVAEVGITKAEASGTVYNLKDLADINGVFAAAGAEGTAGKGAGVSSLRNAKGVVINLKSETKGADIKLAASGLKITLVQ